MEIKAPNVVPRGKFKIFLAGSIEMGKAEMWQDEVVKQLGSYDVILLNPRRDDWDNSWVQDVNNPQFYEQVSWEIANLRDADIVLFYFAPGTQSPITLLEFGMLMGLSNTPTVVCCPDGFWRKGNVDVVCKMAKIPVFDSWQDGVDYIKVALEEIFK